MKLRSCLPLILSATYFLAARRAERADHERLKFHRSERLLVSILRSSQFVGIWHSLRHSVARTTLVVGVTCSTGCATWHEDLMTNQQLVEADCQTLVNEEQKLANNAKHASQASSGGKMGGIFLAVLAGLASAASGTELNVQGAANSMETAQDAEDRSLKFQQRRQLVNAVWARKGCT